MDREMCSKAAETGSKLDKEFFNARTGRSPIGEPKRCQLSTADRWPQRSQNEALQCHSFFSGSSTVVLCAHIYIYIRKICVIVRAVEDQSKQLMSTPLPTMQQTHEDGGSLVQSLVWSVVSALADLHLQRCSGMCA